MNSREQTRIPAPIETLISRCLGDDAVAAAREIERGGLWERVVTHACEAEVGAILDHALRSHGIPLPVSAAMQLDAYREHVAAVGVYQLTRARQALARLQASGVPFLVLKGAALHAAAGEESAPRPMVDIDLLIRPRDADRADRALQDAGCSRGPDLVTGDFFPLYYYEREYSTSQRPPVKIDLHVRPLRPLRYARSIPADALWDHPQQVNLAGLAVQIPSPENMLIHLAAHAACHGLGELKSLHDIWQWLVRFGYQIDIDDLARKCRQWKLAWPVERALRKVSELFGNHIPALAAAIDAVSAPPGLLDRLALAQAPRDAEHPTAALAVNMLCTPGVGFRLGYLKSVLLPGRAHLAQLYHRRHIGWPIAAHLVRILRGLARGSRLPSPAA